MRNATSVRGVRSRSRDVEGVLPARPVWVHLALAFTLAFMAPHMYWAVGGTWGLPPAALDKGSAVQAANWVVSGIMVLGAVLVLALNRPIGRRVPAWLLLAPIWTATVVCLSHGVYGFATKALYLGGWHGAVDFPVVPGVSAATAAGGNHLAAVQDVLVFEPCFTVQGVLLALAAWQFLRTEAGRRRWTVSTIAGTAIVVLFGALLSLGDMHAAIG